MTTLSDRVRGLIIMAIKENGVRSGVGSVMSRIMELLTPDEYSSVEGFLGWAFEDWESRGIGTGNIKSRWREYRRYVRLTPVRESVSIGEGSRCAHCHAILTVVDSITRVYHGTGMGHSRRVPCLGHYTVGGDFESDASVVLPDRAQTFDGDDTCTRCGRVVG